MKGTGDTVVIGIVEGQLEVKIIVEGGWDRGDTRLTGAIDSTLHTDDAEDSDVVDEGDDELSDETVIGVFCDVDKAVSLGINAAVTVAGRVGLISETGCPAIVTGPVITTIVSVNKDE